MNTYGDVCLCMGGDFNEIRKEEERVGKGKFGGNIKRGAASFDEFIRNTALIDLPLQDRSFTFYKPDGTCKSRLDRFLFNSKWMDIWPNISQRGLNRGLSDHSPIVLEEFAIN